MHTHRAFVSGPRDGPTGLGGLLGNRPAGSLTCRPFPSLHPPTAVEGSALSEHEASERDTQGSRWRHALSWMRGGLGRSGEGPSPRSGLQGRKHRGDPEPGRSARPRHLQRVWHGGGPAREGRAWLPGMRPFLGRGLCRPGSALHGRDWAARQDPGTQGAGGDGGRRQALKTEDDGGGATGVWEAP